MSLSNRLKSVIFLFCCFTFMAHATENNTKIPKNNDQLSTHTNYITDNHSYSKIQQNLNKVYFDFDKSAIKKSFAKILDEHAKFLLSHPSFNIMIEGHADERGSSLYNLGLGERRAQAVKDYLVLKGVSSKQIYTVSYGKEKPVSLGEHAKNRRSVIIY